MKKEKIGDCYKRLMCGSFFGAKVCKKTGADGLCLLSKNDTSCLVLKSG